MEEKERSKRKDRTTTSRSEGSGLDNWATDSSLVSFGQNNLLKIWTGSWVFASETVSAGNFSLAVRSLFCTERKKKEEKRTQAAESIEPAEYNRVPQKTIAEASVNITIQQLYCFLVPSAAH